MVASGRIAYPSKRGADFGVISKVELMVDMLKLRERNGTIVESFRGGRENRSRDSGVEVLMGKARLVGENIVSVDMGDGKEEHCTAPEIFSNVGERPTIPDLQGLEELIEDAPG